MVENKSVNLLWPTSESEQTYASSTVDLKENYIKNLGVEQIVQAITLHDTYEYDIRKLLCYICDDEEVIQYRLDILEDFLQ